MITSGTNHVATAVDRSDVPSAAERTDSRLSRGHQLGSLPVVHAMISTQVPTTVNAAHKIPRRCLQRKIYQAEG